MLIAPGIRAAVDCKLHFAILGRQVQKVFLCVLRNGSGNRPGTVNSISNCKVFVAGKKLSLTCTRGSDAYMHAIDITGMFSATVPETVPVAAVTVPVGAGVRPEETGTVVEGVTGEAGEEGDDVPAAGRR